MNRGERRKRSINKYIQRLKYWAETQKDMFPLGNGKWRKAESWKELFGHKGWWNFSKTTQSPTLNRGWKGYEGKGDRKRTYKEMLDVISDIDIRNINY